MRWLPWESNRREGAMTKCLSAGEVYDEEYRAVEKLARDAGLPGVAPDQLLGLALSGGGIRSATFNLGVLQALAELNLLARFDYLSTVSGGGYIGSWFITWARRAGLAEALRLLSPDWRSRNHPESECAPSSGTSRNGRAR